MQMSLNSIDLNLLASLDALLTEHNVTRAAKRMSVGQPAMSASLNRLRKHFGDPLFVREGRGLVLTPLAAALVAPVRAAVAAAEAAFKLKKSFDPGSDSATFTIIASDYVILILLRLLFMRIAAEAPNVRINVIPVRGDYADQLRQGHADLLVLPSVLISPHSGLNGRDLFSDNFVFIVDVDNPQVGDSVSLDQFLELPYVAYDQPLTSVVEDQLDALALGRRVEVSTQSFAIIPSLVPGTLLVGIVQERLAAHFGSAHQIRTLAPPVPLKPIIERLFWHPRDNGDPAHAWMRDLIADVAAGI
jgi:DNA-binding transcriptional LysR family regulator